jgi:D-glycero-alpha-D-manno-heptose-7-phosphate kinase
VNPILAPQSRMAELEQRLVIYFTGFSRIASDIAKEQLKQTPNRYRELKEMQRMVTEAEGIITNPHRSIEEFGSILDESWRLKRSLTDKISNSRIDEIYEVGRRAGALGGKLLGAGGGGFLLFFVPPERRETLAASLKALLCVPFSFSNRGSEVVVYEPEEPYEKWLAAQRCAVYAKGT